MAGIVGGCEAIAPIAEGGDSVIRVSNRLGETSVTFPSSETVTETISESVSVIVT